MKQMVEGRQTAPRERKKRRCEKGGEALRAAAALEALPSPGWQSASDDAR